MDLRTAKKLYFLLLGIFVILMMLMGITSNPVFGYLAIGVMAIYGIFHYFFWRCPILSIRKKSVVMGLTNFMD